MSATIGVRLTAAGHGRFDDPADPIPPRRTTGPLSAGTGVKKRQVWAPVPETTAATAKEPQKMSPPTCTPIPAPPDHDAAGNDGGGETQTGEDQTISPSVWKLATKSMPAVQTPQ